MPFRSGARGGLRAAARRPRGHRGRRRRRRRQADESRDRRAPRAAPLVSRLGELRRPEPHTDCRPAGDLRGCFTGRRARDGGGPRPCGGALAGPLPRGRGRDARRRPLQRQDGTAADRHPGGRSGAPRRADAAGRRVGAGGLGLLDRHPGTDGLRSRPVPHAWHPRQHAGAGHDRVQLDRRRAELAACARAIRRHPLPRRRHLRLPAGRRTSPSRFRGRCASGVYVHAPAGRRRRGHDPVLRPPAPQRGHRQSVRPHRATFTYVRSTATMRAATPTRRYRQRVAAWGARPWTPDEHREYGLVHLQPPHATAAASATPRAFAP